MGKRLCRVQERDNINIAKMLEFKDTNSQSYIGSDENLKIVSEMVEESSSSEDEGEIVYSKQVSFPLKSLYAEWVQLTQGCHWHFSLNHPNPS